MPSFQNKKTKKDATISVSDPIVIEEKFGKHTVYTIQVSRVMPPNLMKRVLIKKELSR